MNSLAMNTSLLILLVSLLILFILIRTFLFLVEVEGWSMFPEYHHEDRLLAIRFWPSRWLRRGQVVVLKLPPGLVPSFTPGASKMYVKRIRGLPEDEVSATVMRPPNPVEGALWKDEAKQELKSWYVPEGHCFVKGDSPGFDSTVFGPLPIHCLRGVILARLRRVQDTPQFYPQTNLPSQMEKVDKP